MKTYIINLKKAERRRRHILAEATARGLDFELVEAVDGSLLSDSEFQRYCDLEAVKRAPDWLTMGMLGAALSHRTVYQRIVESGDQSALVLEDDVNLSDDIAEVAAEAGKLIGENEVLLFHYISFETLGLSTHGSEELPGSRRLMYPEFLKGVMSAAGYVISRSAAEKMAEWLLPIRFAPDCWVDFYEGGAVEKVRCVYPMPVSVIGAKSTIEATNQSKLRVVITDTIDKYQIPVLHQIFTALRLKSVASRLKFTITSERSPLDTD